MTSFPEAPAEASMNIIRRPLRDLLRHLPSLPIGASGEPVWAAADPDLLVSLAESAELVLQIVHSGFAAIGLLQSHTSQQIEDGELKATHAAALGRLVVELGEVLAYAQALAVECRRYTADYVNNRSEASDD